MTAEQINAEQARAALDQAATGRRRILAEGNAVPPRLLLFVGPYIAWWGMEADFPESWLKSALHVGVVVLMCVAAATATRLGRLKLRAGAAGPLGYLLLIAMVALNFAVYLMAFGAFRSLDLAPRLPATVLALCSLVLTTFMVNRAFRALALRRVA